MVLLIALVAVMTAMWPINKFATQRGARPETLGMVTCFCGMVLSVGYLLADGSSWGNGKILLLGFFGGIAYAVGFFVLITSCLTTYWIRCGISYSWRIPGRSRTAISRSTR